MPQVGLVVCLGAHAMRWHMGGAFAGTVDATAKGARGIYRPMETYQTMTREQVDAVVPQHTSPAFDYTVLEIVLMGRAPYLGGMSLESSEDLEIARQTRLRWR